MSSFAKSMILVFALTAVFSVSRQAEACGNCRGGFNGAYGFGYSGSLYGLGYIPVPPYHAIHPPVYYGQRVYRSYGRSPFASRPARVQATKAKPRMIVNKTMKAAPKKAGEKATSSRTASVQPKLIINPFVDGNASPRYVAKPR